MSIRFWLTKIILAIFYLCGHTAAQNIHYKEVLNTSNGAPSNLIYCLHQDKRGYIWAGTAKGLIRYSGTDINVFTNEDGSTDNEIFHILEDKDTTLYFSTYTGGISYFKNEKMKAHPLNDKVIESLEDYWLDSWFIDEGSTIFYSPAVRNIPRKSNGVYYKLNESNLEKQFSTSNLNFNSNYSLGIFKKQILILYNNSTTYPKFRGRIQKAHYSYYNEVLFSIENTLYCYNLENERLDSLVFNEDIIQSILSTKEYLLVGTTKGLYKTANQGKSTILGLQKIISNQNISSLLLDKENGLWIGTLGNGLLRIKSLENDVKNINNIKKIVKVKDQKYLLTNTGVINLFDSNMQYSYKDFISHFSTHWSLISLKTNINVIKDFTYIKELKQYCIATDVGVLLFDSIGQMMHSKTHGFELRCNSLAYKNSIIYIGTVKGLYSWNLSKNRIEQIPIKGNKLPIEKVTTDDFGNIYVGTNGNGIYKLQIHSTKLLNHYNTQNGLSSNFIQDILIYKNEIWACTNRGLNIFKESKKWYFSNTNDALISNDVNSIWIESDSILYISYPSQVQSFLVKNLFSPVNYYTKIHIESIKSANKEIDKENILNINALNRNVSIKVNSISFNSDVIYYYKFDFEKSYNRTKSNYIELQNLPAGKYTLKIDAKKVNGSENFDPTYITFSVQAFYYETLWFKILIFTLTAISAFLTGLLILRIINQKTKNKLQIISLEQKALKSQMNPHFIFNTLNSVLYFIRTDKKAEAVKYVTNLAHLQRKLLGYSFKNLTTLENEIEILENYLELEKLRFGSKVVFEISFPKEDLGDYLIPPMLIQPIIENALIHGLGGMEKDAVLKVDVSVKDEKTILVNIIDNGSGFDLNSPLPADSVGVKNILQRIELYNSLHPGFIGMTIIKPNPENSQSPGTKVSLVFNQEKITNS